MKAVLICALCALPALLVLSPDVAWGQEESQETSPLLDPRGEAMNEKAPDIFKTKFETTKGDLIIEVHRDWAPRGADRFYNLVRHGFYDGCRFFRVIEGFVAQIGISGDPAVGKAWRNASMLDDPVVKSNKPGYLTYAKTSAPHSRTTQFFINYVDNSRLDKDGFAPFGKVVEGMDVAKKFYAGYGRGVPGPDQGRLQAEGNAYLERDFPELDYVKKASILEEKKEKPAEK